MSRQDEGESAMSDRIRRIFEALGGAALALFIVRWVDTDVVSSIDRSAGQNFDPLPAAFATSLAYLLVAAGAILIVFLAWRSKELMVGIAYTVGGAFLTFLFPVTWFLTAKGNNPAILSGPFADILDRIWTKAEQRPLNSVAILGAVMLLAGLSTIGSVVRQRRTRPTVAPVSPIGLPASSH
jgi:hypothetical protein